MIGILSLLIVLTLSLFLTRIASMALMLTGLSRDSARFQARSAFTGVGFTTNESESLVTHPVRRRIIMMLMLLGNLGIATVVATTIITYIGTANSEQWTINLLFLAIGLTVLYWLANNRFIEKQLNIIILLGLKRWTKLDVKDYNAILHLEGGFAISELQVNTTDWLCGKTLKESELSKEGVLVLGVKRKKGNYVGIPQADTDIRCGDILTVYAGIARLEELDKRRKGRHGEKAHKEAVSETIDIVEKEEAIDEVEVKENIP